MDRSVIMRMYNVRASSFVLMVLFAFSFYGNLHSMVLTSSMLQIGVLDGDLDMLATLPRRFSGTISSSLHLDKGDHKNQMVEPSPSERRRPRPRRKWAYAFLMAGVDIKHRGYRGILYNVLVVAEIMRDSAADVILMVQMSSPLESHLSPQEEGWLHAMNVTIKYLDYPSHGIQNFYTVQLEKFHILEFTEYSRVIFMDGDVLPVCPLDYIFEMSEPLQGPIDNSESASTAGTVEETPPLLRENMVIAFQVEPAHGGFFMLTPKEGDFDLLEGVVHRREDEVLATGQVFDPVRGWGHVIEPPDHWRSEGGHEGLNASLWKWHGDFVDQGLLYYWTKYFKRSVSIIIGGQVENWSSRKTNSGEAQEVYLEKTWELGCTKYKCIPEVYLRPSSYNYGSGYEQFLSERDFQHFTGTTKPWLREVQSEINMDRILRRFTKNGYKGIRSPQEYWYLVFHRVHKRLNMSVATWEDEDIVDIHNLKIPEAKLGRYPTFRMMNAVIEARTGNSTSHVQSWSEWNKVRKATKGIYTKP